MKPSFFSVLYSFIRSPRWIVLLTAMIFIGCQPSGKNQLVVMRYPADQTLFPSDFGAPLFSWDCPRGEKLKFKIYLRCGNETFLDGISTSSKTWRPDDQLWKKLSTKGSDKKFVFEVKTDQLLGSTKAQIRFSFSGDPVGAPVFYRAVPLPFKFARENMKRIKWYFGDLTSSHTPDLALEKMPVCANCHSFSMDGKTIGMDVDAVDDKGAYALSQFQNQTHFATDSIMSWSKFQKGKFTYGLLSQVSPDGRFVVSTLKDCEIFVDRNDLEYSQLFFPFKGILVVWDRKEKKFTELKGANDTTFVQSNPVWTPDGKTILFARAKAKHFEESGIMNGSVARPQDQVRYKKFEKTYLNRDSLMKFDIYSIPFNDGKGGVATPVEGASRNGKSNYFPRVSPDGKWLVFCQAESFMLLQKDSRLMIKPMNGGKAEPLSCNTGNMNSWHSWSPNSKWLVFSSKANGPYTQLYLTHIREDGTSSPAIFLDWLSFDQFANNIPEFVNTRFDSKLKIEPEFMSGDDFLIRTGDIHQANGEDDLAFKAFNDAVLKFPTNAEAYFKRSRVYFQRKQMQEALNDLNKAISLARNREYFLNRGILYLKTGKNELALSDLKTAYSMDPTDPNANTYLGVAYVEINQPGKAIDFLKNAIAKQPEDYYSLYYLGLAYFDGNKFQEAEGAFSQGIQTCKSNGLLSKLYELRANCVLKSGKIEQALSDLDQALSIHGNDASLFLQKGKLYLQMRRNQEAYQALQQAAALGSQQARDLLQSLR